MKKLTAFMLALVMLCACLTGCAGGTKNDTVMTVNGTDVSYDEYMIWLGQAVSELTDLYKSYSGTAVDWNGKFLFDDEMTNIEWCVKRATQSVTRLHAMEAKAKELGVTVTDEDKQAVADEIEQLKKNYNAEGESESAALFASYNYTEESYTNQRTLNYLYNNLFNELYGPQGEKLSEDKVLAYAEENKYVTSAHILFRTSEDVTDEDGKTSSKELSDSEKAEKKAQAQKLSEELQAISDNEKRWERFKELMTEYSEDPGKEKFPNGYCFTTGTMVPEYDTASRELKEYEVSGVVESQHGYHVIMRLPTKSTDLVTYMTSSYQQQTVPLSYIAAPADYDSQIADWASSATVKTTKLYDELDFSKLITSDGFKFVPFSEYSAEKK